MDPPAPSRLSLTAAPAEPARRPKLLDRVRRALAERQIPPARIDEYLQGLAASIRIHDLRHPRELGLEHSGAFLARLRRHPALGCGPLQPAPQRRRRRRGEVRRPVGWGRR